MRTLRFALLCSFASVLLPLFAAPLPAATSLPSGVSLNPSRPQAATSFEITIAGTWRDSCSPEVSSVIVLDKTIHLTYVLGGGGCLSAVMPFSATAKLPGLAAGTYDVRARLFDFSGLREFFAANVDVEGPPPGITTISPSFDTGAGNRVVVLRGSFPCDTTCAAPEVLFGNMKAESVERISATEVHAVVPFQTNIRTVDVTVRASGYSYTLPNGFTYVSRSEYEVILVPLLTKQPVPGARGSLWKTEFQVVNQSAVDWISGFDIFPLEARCGASCPPALAPRAQQSPLFATPLLDSMDVPALQFYVRSEFSSLLAFSLRIRDLSRQAESWGTDVPVVRGRDIDWSVTLVDIPLEQKFRQMLRVYMPDYVGCCGAHVQFFSAEGQLLFERDVTLQRANGSIGGLAPAPYLREGSREFPLQPAYAQLELQSIPELQGQKSVWARVTSSARVWSFVSVTNDETQHVTLITPK